MNNRLFHLTALAIVISQSDFSRAAEKDGLETPLPPVADTFSPPAPPGVPALRKQVRNLEEVGLLAQAGGATAPGVPGLDPSAIAEWASSVASMTTERTLDSFFPRSTPQLPALVGGERDAKTSAALEEDLNIMMRILEKSAGAKEDGKPTAGGIELFSFSSSGSPRVFYIDGYGAMFVLRVKYPLVNQPEKDADNRTNQPVSTEWEKAREEVTGRPRAVESYKLPAGATEEFDAQRVENLKHKLMESLIHASNIRHLKADDSVTVVLAGTGARIGSQRRDSKSGGGRGNGRSNANVDTALIVVGAEPVTQTTMTLRVKKSDVDALAKGAIQSAEFEKRVHVQAYASRRGEGR